MSKNGWENYMKSYMLRNESCLVYVSNVKVDVTPPTMMALHPYA